MNPDYFKLLKWLEPAPPNFRELFQLALKEGTHSAKLLRQLAQFSLDEPQLHQLGRAFMKTRSLGVSWEGLNIFKLAILSNCTTGHLITPLIATALRYGVNLEVLCFSYSEAYTVAIGGDQRLIDFAPNAVLIAIDHHGLPLREILGYSNDEQQTINDCTCYLQAIVDGIHNRISTVCLMQSIAYPISCSFGHADKKISGSIRRVLDAVNQFITGAADIVLDIASLAGMVGTSHWFDSKLFHNSKIPFSLPFVPLYADHVCRVIGAMSGKSRRVLVLDLDNTLWGGIVGDDGVEGITIGNGSALGESFIYFQNKVLSLRKRGVLLAVSSKNDDLQARRPFQEIQDMVLKEHHFSAFHANWNDKASNILAISQQLSLGLDTFVFIDDNPLERDLVRKFLPEVAVPELPLDPAFYTLVLDAAGYFEAVSFSDEDTRRADLYQTRGVITHLAANDLDTYLSSLEMKLEIETVNIKNRTRVVQLINKSNQFNLTTRRYTDFQIQDIELNSNFLKLAYRLVDKQNDHGIISVLLCEKSDVILDIALWVMSCRVIGRGVESAVLIFLIKKARQLGCSFIRGLYIPTARNKLVENHYAKMGFTQDLKSNQQGTVWLLDLDNACIDVKKQMQIVDNTESIKYV